MPAALREVTRDDLIPDGEFAVVRKERRAALLPVKKLRRLDLGPYCTFYFENFDTMLFQIQEMLLIEKGGEPQVADELAAYNPLIPQGGELVATVMFEVDDPVKRANLLGNLGDVERHFYIQVGEDRIPGLPEGDVERSREDGKTSSVHFLRFGFTPDQVAAFRASDKQVLIGCDDARYPHLVMLGSDVRAELARDFA
jgi:hypothetical protein